MSLNWNITACTNFESLQSEEEWTVTDTLIWATMIVGMREITEANAAEFYARLHIFESLNGSLVFSFDENGERQPHFITPEDVMKRIGLRTNASTETFAAFTKRHLGLTADSAKRRYEHVRSALVTA